MDFLPLPDGVTAHESIPDLGGLEYDNEGFFGYDQRQGWDINALRKGDLFAARKDWHDYTRTSLERVSRPESLAGDDGGIQTVVGSFVQTWILFGILQEALDRPVYRHEVSVAVPVKRPASATHQMIKSIIVRPLFREFVTKAEQLRTDAPRAAHLFRCLRAAASLLSDLDRALFVGLPLVPTAVQQALAVLVETFHEYTWLFCPRHLHHEEEHIIVHNRMPRQRLGQLGFCPNLIERVGTGFHSTGLYYLSILPGLETNKTMHGACQDLACVAYNIDPETYKVQHVPENCLCHDSTCDHTQATCCCRVIAISESEAQSAFEGEGFPVIEFRQDDIQITRHYEGMKYVALSHVWSDGRGNPSANALPICQIRCLHQYVTASTFNQVSRFWIDTLCVPISEPLRNTAIVRMNKVYSSASSVLVLSADLLSSPGPCTIDEFLLRLYCCQWNTRLWTRQEAALAKDICFQFLDTVVRYSELVAGRNYAVTHVAQTDRSCLISILSERWLIGVFNLRSTSKTGPLSLEDFWAGLRYRSTSRPMDVAITGSILMETDLTRVLEAAPDMKMQAFWSCQPRLPTGILWVSGPRLKTPGFSWAPSNLLDPVTTMGGPRSGPVAEQTSAGLLVDGVQAILLKDFRVLLHELDMYWFCMEGSPQRYFICKEMVSEPITVCPDELQDAQSALLLPQLPRYDGEDAALVVLKHPSKEECIDDISRPIAARYHEKVWIYKEEGVFAQQRLAVTRDSRPEAVSILERNGGSEVPELQLMSPRQQWLIY